MLFAISIKIYWRQLVWHWIQGLCIMIFQAPHNLLTAQVSAKKHDWILTNLHAVLQLRNYFELILDLGHIKYSLPLHTSFYKNVNEQGL